MVVTKQINITTPSERRAARKALLAHPGEMAAVARKLGVTPALVSLVMKGRGTSERVMSACLARASELEQQHAN